MFLKKYLDVQKKRRKFNTFKKQKQPKIILHIKTRNYPENSTGKPRQKIWNGRIAIQSLI